MDVYVLSYLWISDLGLRLDLRNIFDENKKDHIRSAISLGPRAVLDHPYT